MRGLGGLCKNVISMTLSKKAHVITIQTLKVAKNWTAHEKFMASFRGNIFKAFAERFKDSLK